MPNFAIYAVAASASLSARQALSTFGVDDDKDTKRSLGVTAVKADGVTHVGPATAAVDPIVATTILDVPVLALTVTRGVRIYSEADERVWLGFSDQMTALTAAMFIDPDGQDYFAPPYSNGYAGPVYILAQSGAAGKKVRFQPW